MTRLLSSLAFLAVVVGLYLLPQPSPVHLAAMHAGAVLQEDVYHFELGDTFVVLIEGQPTQATLVALDKQNATVDLEGLEQRQYSLKYLLPAIVTTPEAPVPGRNLGRKLWQLLDDLATEDPEFDGRVARLRMLEQALMFGGDDPILAVELANSVLRALRAIGTKEDFRVLEYTQHEPDLEPFVKDDFHLVGMTGSQLKAGAVQLIVDLPDGRIVWARSEYYPPDGRSLIPPLVAILLAILLRKPVIALLAGIAVGSVLALVVAGGDLMGALLPGLRGVADNYLWNELIAPDRQKVVAFVIFMLAMVGVIIRAGGIHGLMQRIARLARDARRTQIATWFMGLAVFFDDYANTILVGSTMRSLSDKWRVSREKLAYIVDSTAAPVAGISILSTWIAFEVSTFSSQLPAAGLSPDDGYAIFIQTLPYRFYCIFTLFFVGLIVFTGRDFGPMLRAERRARGGKVLRDGAQPMVGEAATELTVSDKVTPAAYVALIPILTFVAVTLGYIFIDGGGHQLGAALFTFEGAATVLYEGSGFDPLMYGSLAGLLVACMVALKLGLRGEIATSAFASLRSMGVGLAILYLAWSIGAICAELNTAEYLSVVIGDSINPLLLPVILFGLSGFVAFSTGSSWSTMTILLPLVVGLAYTMGESLDGFGGVAMVVVSIGAVLEGAIWGDHCSPISDTTIMSSIACASDHVDHVRTQMPYALLTMVAAILFGYLPAVVVGLSPWISILMGCAALTVFVYWKGERADEAAAVTDTETGGAPGTLAP
jgi:Na+/H+ antiporter NhaC